MPNYDFLWRNPMPNTMFDLLEKGAILEAGRLKRASKISLSAPTAKTRGKKTSWTGAYKTYNLEMVLLHDKNEVEISCSCPDWFAAGGAQEQEGSLNTRPCKHLLAFAEKCIIPPQNAVDFSRPVDVRPLTKAKKSASAKSNTASAALPFGEQVSDEIGLAITNLSFDIEELLLDGQVPLVIGPTGCGKTSAHRMIALRNKQSLVESAGAASYSDADMVGIVHVNGDPFPGPIADAFSAAREMDENVLLFLDEFTRFNARAQEALMRPLLPIAADAAQAMGIDTQVPVRITSAPFWGTEWGPAEKIQMSLACNPWGTTIDPALIRRTTPVFAGFPDDLAELFSDKVGQAIKASWSAVEDGRWPLPIEYQALAKAKSPDDASIFRAYSHRLRAIDPAAADGFTATLQSLGF
jgi:hypothetical protein